MKIRRITTAEAPLGVATQMGGLSAQGRVLQLGQGGGDRTRRRPGDLPAGDHVPAALLVNPLQRLRHDLRKRLVGVERRQEQGAHHVDVGLHGITRLGGERVDRERDRGRVGGIDHGDLRAPARAGADEPPGDRPVLRLDGLDRQPGQPGTGELLQQMPHSLRFPGPGGTGHQGMPVQGRQRHTELAHRPVEAIEDHPQAERIHRLTGFPA